MRLAAEKVKINLCNEKQPQEFFLEAPTPDIDEINYTLSVAEFERMLKPLMDRAMVEVDVALASAKSRHELTAADVDAFILVGGSSRIPWVGPALQERYKKPVKSNLNPDEIVAMGAARMALNYEPSEGVALKDNEELRIDAKAAAARPEELTDTHIKDVVSHTLGVGLKDDVYDPLIEKDHVIPHKVVRKGYTTAQDSQTSIYVPVYQGDNPKASQNFLLGQVTIDGLAPQPKGVHQFQITFALDADGIFTGEVAHLNENRVTPIKLDRGQGAMHEKKRIDLAKMVETGMIGPSSPPAGGGVPSRGGAGPEPSAGDPLDQMIKEAADLLPTLPAARQRELSEVLSQLQQARAAKDARAIAGLVPQLAMLLVRMRG
jgi:molecular chaperone DnaK (HSP70)